MNDQGALQFGPSSPRVASLLPSNRAVALEEEMERLKAEHCRQLVEAQDATRGRLEELTQQVDALQNQVASLDLALRSARDTLRQERFDWHAEKESLRSEVIQLNLQAETSGVEAEQQREREQQHLQEELESAKNAQYQQQLRLEDLDERLKESKQNLETSRREVAECRARASTLDEQLTESRQTEKELNVELSTLRCRESELYQTVASLQQHRPSSAAAKKLQVQQASLLAKLQEVETRNALLASENRTLREQLAALQSQLDRSASPSSPPRAGSVFAVHVDLKRENLQLRTQVEELKQLQRKFLTTAKKKTLAFPAL